MRNKRVALTAAAVLAGSVSLWGMTGPAVAAPEAGAVLTYGLNGTDVAVGHTLSASGSGSLTSPDGSVVCTDAGFTGTVSTNGSAPGTATLSGVQVSIDNEPSTCTIDLPGATGVISIDVNGSGTASITTPSVEYAAKHADGDIVVKNATGGSITAVGLLDSFFGPIECDYAISELHGWAQNQDNNSINFENQAFHRTNSEPTCPATTYFSARLAPVTGPGGAVWSNPDTP
jgi:hypothetical protein